MTHTKPGLIEIANWLLQNAIVIDTETTGLDTHDTVVEIAAIRASDGQVLVNKLTAPSSIMNPEAQRVNGITEEEALNAPPFFEIYDELISKVSDGEFLTSFNRGFDERLVRQSMFLSGAKCGPWPTPGLLCLQELANRFFHEHLVWDSSRSCFKRLSLARCLEIAGIEQELPAHRALSDAKAALTLLKFIAAQGGSDVAK